MSVDQGKSYALVPALSPDLLHLSLYSTGGWCKGWQSGGRAVDDAWVTLTMCLQAASVSPVHTQLPTDRLAEKTLCCGLALLMMLGLR